MPGKTDALSAAEIRRRLARTRMPEDPLAVDWTGARERLSEKELQAMQGDLRAAAVLIPIIERDSDLTVLLTERSAELRHHAGQISFPGGGMEAGDLSIANTALREAHEEVGIRPAQVEIAGFLDPTPTVTGFAVTSVIGIVEDSISVSIDEQEVAETLSKCRSHFCSMRAMQCARSGSSGV